MNSYKLHRSHGHAWLAGLVALSIHMCVTAAGAMAAEESPPTWRFTLEQPADGWEQADFDDSAWQEGEGGFGTRGTPGARVATVWNTNDVWLRKSFELDSVPEKPALFMHHDEDVEVYLNGRRVASLTGWTVQYELTPLDAEARAALRPGRNAMAVHCRQSTGGQFIDVHFADADAPPSLPPMKPFLSELITTWGEEVTAENAWTEYPRPQLAREQWQNLNGHWDYAVTSAARQAAPDAWDGEILVPYCLESKLGGVQRMLDPTEALWYRRTFQSSPQAKRRTLLNFEAVDYRCQAFVNGKLVGTHQGGNTPFTFDVTEALREGENELIVRVEDETEGWQLHGKQVRNPGGIMYTQVSGIWQTVWLEEAPADRIVDLTFATNVETGAVTVRSEVAGSQGASVRIVVRDEGRPVAEAVGTLEEATAMIPQVKLWSPSSPHLYDLEVALLDSSGDVLDQVSSYVGIRSVGKARDAEGRLRMTLNGEPLFHWGPLDQGWWPDGLLTPPSDEAMLFDVEWLKSAGFNMIRKHIKVEPRRYYYHCDRLGMLVWQDQVSGGASPRWTHLAPNPEDAEWPDARHEQFLQEFDWMIDSLENHPCIVVWTPFNEAWGQHRTVEVGRWAMERDPTRLINIASGGNFWPVGDVVDQHAYPSPDFPFDSERFAPYIQVVGEFGGHGYPVKGHLWDAERENWGYGGLPKTKEEYRERYVATLDRLNELRRQGIAAGVYTQTTDVEGEINGLLTYDRKVGKIPPEELRELHQRLFTAE